MYVRMYVCMFVCVNCDSMYRCTYIYLTYIIMFYGTDNYYIFFQSCKFVADSAAASVDFASWVQRTIQANAHYKGQES